MSYIGGKHNKLGYLSLNVFVSISDLDIIEFILAVIGLFVFTLIFAVVQNEQRFLFLICDLYAIAMENAWLRAYHYFFADSCIYYIVGIFGFS